MEHFWFRGLWLDPTFMSVSCQYFCNQVHFHESRGRLFPVQLSHLHIYCTWEPDAWSYRSPNVSLRPSADLAQENAWHLNSRMQRRFVLTAQSRMWNMNTEPTLKQVPDPWSQTHKDEGTSRSTLILRHALQKPAWLANFSLVILQMRNVLGPCATCLFCHVIKAVHSFWKYSDKLRKMICWQRWELNQQSHCKLKWSLLFSTQSCDFPTQSGFKRSPQELTDET